MPDPALVLTLDHLLVVSEYACTCAAPIPGHGSYTVCLWLRADDLERTQVIAHQGGPPDAPGWRFFIAERALHFELCDDSGRVAEVIAPLDRPGVWRHAAMVIDRAAGRMTGYLDGAAAGDCPLPDGAAISPAAVLTVGGYTDPAGGHFDHTFGRNGAGLADDLRIYAAALPAAEIAAFVDPANRPPVARFSIAREPGDAPLTVRFDAGDSRDPDGTIRAWLWDFGDGSSGMSRGAVADHHYEYGGRYRVRLVVIDDDHGQATAERALTLRGQPNPLRMAPVFVNGAEGHACYRIPAIVRAANGDLLAFAEGRVASCSDSTRVIRIVCKRSTDQGATWGPLQVIGRNLIDGEEYAAQNPSPVVDTGLGAGRVILLFNKLEHSEWDLARGIGRSRIVMLVSDDHGQTWREETDITPFVADPDGWRVQRPTIGHAIQLRHGPVRGRLLYAGVFTQGERSVFDSQNYVFWTDDLGHTWQIGGVLPCIGLNEAIAAELEGGGLLINSRAYRDQRPLGRRAVTRAVWDAQGRLIFGETAPDDTLIDPAVQASLIRLTWADQEGSGSRSRLLFSNPAHPRARRQMTVRLSYDDGQTWPISRVVDPGPSAYSDLVIQADGRIGLLYERGNQGGIWYVNFTLDWLTRGQDHL